MILFKKMEKYHSLKSKNQRNETSNPRYKDNSQFSSKNDILLELNKLKLKMKLKHKRYSLNKSNIYKEKSINKNSIIIKDNNKKIFNLTNENYIKNKSIYKNNLFKKIIDDSSYTHLTKDDAENYFNKEKILINNYIQNPKRFLCLAKIRIFL